MKLLTMSKISLQKVKLWLQTLILRHSRHMLLIIGKEDRYSARFFLKMCYAHWRFVLLSFLGGTLAAFFEGITLGIFALALQVLTTNFDSAVLATEIRWWSDEFSSLFTVLGQEGIFLLLVGLAVGSQLLRSGVEFIGNAATAYLRTDVEGDVRRRIFRQIMAFSYPQARAYKTGDLASYNEQVNYLGLAIEKLNIILKQILLMIAYLLILLWLSWEMTLVAIFTLILLSIGMRRIVQRIRFVSSKFRQHSVWLNERTVEFVYGFRLVRIFAREQHAISKVDEAIDEGTKAKKSSLLWQATLSPLIDSFSVVGIALFLLGGYLFLADSQAALARLATYLFTMYRMLPRVSIVNKNWGLFNGYWPFVERIANFLRIGDKEFRVPGRIPFSTLKTEINFQEVALRYHADERWAIKNASFVIPRGTMIAFVGESGAGKTSIVNLILRLYEPVRGMISVDGIPLSSLNLNQWLERIGVVTQETFVFNTSIQENIAFGKLEASEEEIIAAAKAAHAHEFIIGLSEGYNTIIGDKGYRLSGGQRQRLAIARAILRNPELLILDEATSDLDSHSEKVIQEALENLRKHRTVIAIAHRLSTIAMADKIIVLQKGQIVEMGTHDELLSIQGEYAQMWQLQSGKGGLREKHKIP